MTDPQTPSASPQNPSALKFWKCHCPEYNNHSVGAWNECSKCGANNPLSSPHNPVSDCCHATCHIEFGPGNTNWWECNRCKKICTTEASAGTVFGNSHHGGVLPSNKAASVPAVQKNPEMEKLELSSEAAEYLWQYESSLMTHCCETSGKAERLQAEEDKEVLKTYIRTMEKRNALLEDELKKMKDQQAEDQKKADSGDCPMCGYKV